MLSTDCPLPCGYASVCGTMPLMANLTAREDQRRRALDTIMRALDVKDAHLGVALKISRSAVQNRRSGGVKLREDQVDEMADALHVPAELFGCDVPEVLRWLADNRSEQVYLASGWLVGTADRGCAGHELARSA